MSDFKSSLQMAKTIALTLVNRDTDINELAKIATYIRTHRDGAQFFRLLETMVKDGRHLVRTGRTLDYYRDLQDVCQQSLGAYRNAKDSKAQEMAEILGWAVRLMRYYKGAGVAPSEQLSSKAPEPSASSASTPKGTLLRSIKRETEPKQAMPTTNRVLVTLVEDAKRDRAQVETSDGEHIVCTGFPVYPSAKRGMRCRADVTRQDGKAQRATFKRWE